MKTGTKIFLSIVLVLGIAAGVWFIYDKVKKSKAGTTDDGTTNGGTKPGTTNTANNSNVITNAVASTKPINADTISAVAYAVLPDGDFPIKLGSKNKLVHLFQHLLNTVYTDVNLTEDGSWQGKTDAVVKGKLLTDQIDKATAKAIYLKVPTTLASSFAGYSQLIQSKILK